MEDVMVLCKKCGNKAPASSMKLDLDEKKIICPECVKSKKIHKEIQEEVLHKTDNTKKPVSKVFLPDVKEEKSSKVAHKCTSCSYKFMIDLETKKPKNCPYCNSRVMSF